MQALSIHEQRQMKRDIQEIKALLQMRSINAKWVDMKDAKEITGLGRTSIIAKAKEGIFNTSKTGNKTQYYRPDLEKYRLENSTLKQ